MIAPLLLILGIAAVAVAAVALIATLLSAKDDADANFSRQAKPGAPVAKCPLATVKTGLGDDIDKGVSKCPAFAAKLDDLKSKGWTLDYGTAGKGSYCDKNAKKIVIDSNEKGNSTAILETLAHECGHAGYTPDPSVGPAGLTRSEYAAKNANSALKDEGEATLTNVEIKQCLAKNGGADIGVAGAQSAEYEKIAKKYPDPKDRDKARQEIADLFADGEHPSTQPDVTYRQYYEKPYLDYYDKVAGKAP